MTDIKDLTWTNGDEHSLKALWEAVLDRYEEAKGRNPDFMPIFQLRESYKGTEYSIHFIPDEEKGTELRKVIEELGTKGFPVSSEWKPIEILPSYLGTELDLIFNRFPDQTALETEVTNLVQSNLKAQPSKLPSLIGYFSSLLTTMAYIFTPTIVVMYFIISGQSNYSRLHNIFQTITIKSTKQPDKVTCANNKCDRQTFTYLIKGKNGEVTTVNIEGVADK
ncbi:hypothetical protein [Argonema antarcticum]|uniref:hypothetical protein n=1 Tax=Argonema antarcticum TaxID=2942763 RepID=UPI002011D158|nr:hypothetical protein [Argonema antarcticum]MCL1474604.1 hypothetical protein [Argonema antarcticum A004/B2]